MEPSGNGNGRCTNPFPNVRRPTITPRSLSWRAPERISLADAENWLTITTTRPSRKSPLLVASYRADPFLGESVYTIRSPLLRNLLAISVDGRRYPPPLSVRSIIRCLSPRLRSFFMASLTSSVVVPAKRDMEMSPILSLIMYVASIL